MIESKLRKISERAEKEEIKYKSLISLSKVFSKISSETEATEMKSQVKNFKKSENS